MGSNSPDVDQVVAYSVAWSIYIIVISAMVVPGICLAYVNQRFTFLKKLTFFIGTFNLIVLLNQSPNFLGYGGTLEFGSDSLLLELFLIQCC